MKSKVVKFEYMMSANGEVKQDRLFFPIEFDPKIEWTVFLYEKSMANRNSPEAVCRAAIDFWNNKFRDKAPRKFVRLIESEVE